MLSENGCSSGEIEIKLLLLDGLQTKDNKISGKIKVIFLFCGCLQASEGEGEKGTEQILHTHTLLLLLLNFQEIPSKLCKQENLSEKVIFKLKFERYIEIDHKNMWSLKKPNSQKESMMVVAGTWGGEGK